MPVFEEKNFENVQTSSIPIEFAISVIDKSVSNKRIFDSEILQSSIYFFGEIPAYFINILYIYRGMGSIQE